MTPTERFLSRINRTGKCWLWTGTLRGKNSYGCFEVNGKLISAHRFSYELYYGTIKDGLFVLHRCDNKLCVNPEHLFLGTSSDNNKDRANKQRSWRPTGELHPVHILTEKEVLMIRKQYKTGMFSQRALARKYNVAQWTIGKVLNRLTWSHV